MLRKGNLVLLSSIMSELNFINENENSTVSTSVETEPILRILILQSWVTAITHSFSEPPLSRTDKREDELWDMNLSYCPSAGCFHLSWTDSAPAKKCFPDSLGWNYRLLLNSSKITCCVSDVNLVTAHILF